MRRYPLASVLLLLLLGGCHSSAGSPAADGEDARAGQRASDRQPQSAGQAGSGVDAPRPEAAAASPSSEPGAAPAVEEARRDAFVARSLPEPRPGTPCARFVARIAEFAEAHPSDRAAFLRALQDEFVGGTDDPFALKEGLDRGRWNQEHVYAGHGGFRDEYDDADRGASGGNHQPGHFVAVLSVAARFGEEQAKMAIAYAGDYEEGQEDDLRLSGAAIRLGSRLGKGEILPADVAMEVRGLCR